ncbi:MAG: 4Fe-4S cluster-binding domain-containing protein, partial [Actinobacteria bacterium]
MSNKFAWHGPAFGSMRAQSYGGGFVPFVVHAAGQIQSPNLEYNVVEHCNYACRECSHFSPHMPAHQADLPTFRRDLAALQAVYHVGRFRFVGGEPLLNKNLVEFVTAVRDSGIADKIEVATNGSLVHKAPDELFEAIDFFNISWYPDRRCDAAKVKLAEEKCRTHATVFKARAVSKFRLMQIDRRTADARLVKDIYDTCQLAHSWHCQTFYEGYFYLCSRPTLTARYLEQRGVEIPDLRTRDGVSLHEPRLGERLRAYLENPEPLESCHYCLGTVGSRIPWQQSSLAERRSTAP